MASQNFDSFHLADLKEKFDAKSPILGALFFFSLFFLTFLLIYFVYACTHRRGASNAPPPRAAGLDPAAISALPIVSYGSAEKKPAECAICLSVFEEGDRVKVLPVCRHGFHPVCVDKWLRSRSSCPLCRACVQPAGSLSRQLGSEIP